MLLIERDDSVDLMRGRRSVGKHQTMFCTNAC